MAPSPLLHTVVPMLSSGAATSNLGIPLILGAVVLVLIIAVVFFVRRRR